MVGKPCFKTAIRRAENRKRKAPASGRSVTRRLLSNLGGLFFAGEIALRPSPKCARAPGDEEIADSLSGRQKGQANNTLAVVPAGTMFDAVEHALCRSGAHACRAAGRCYGGGRRGRGCRTPRPLERQPPVPVRPVTERVGRSAGGACFSFEDRIACTRLRGRGNSPFYSWTKGCSRSCRLSQLRYRPQ